MGEGRGATHYNWRPDVRRLVDYIEYWYATAANTYYNHPTGWWLDDVSVDFWSPWGRGSPSIPPWETRFGTTCSMIQTPRGSDGLSGGDGCGTGPTRGPGTQT